MSKGARFLFITGIRQPVFSNAWLSGSWDGNGVYSTTWSSVAMQPIIGLDGCPALEAMVNLDSAQTGTSFNWGVTLDGPAGSNGWGIPTEVGDPNLTDRYRTFVLEGGTETQQVEYYLTYTRALGARKVYTTTGAQPRIAFRVWAPYAQDIDVVFGTLANGYIDDNGVGIDPTLPAIPLTKDANDIWSSDPSLYAFADLAGKPYMYRIVNEQGVTTYRTDLYSLYQVGTGSEDPAAAVPPDVPYTGNAQGLDGSVSCSVVVDPDTVVIPGQATPISDSDFWANEFTTSRPVPTRIEDLVIYELHVSSLGYGSAAPGNLMDAVSFLDHLTLLGVNAVELLPLAQYDGDVGWGYGDTHHFAIQSAVEGRNEYRLFVRECHRRGIAVIQDVVYNHFDDDGAERAEKYYDSTADNHNLYYWYEGVPGAYADPQFGYLNNNSTGYTPCFWQERVRSMFTSSAAAFVMDLHVDGFRVDLTDAIHQNNALNLAPSFPAVPNANAFGCKFLREWSRTLRLLKPTVMLAAEDYSGWAAMTQLPDNGGMGFDSIWYADFIHHLIGDGDYGLNYARLIHHAGLGGDDPLKMDYFGGALQGTGDNRVVYHENHDEAGNETDTRRTIVEAVDGAPPHWRHATICGSPLPVRRRYEYPLGRHPDVFHGGGDRRPESLPLRDRNYLAGARRHPRADDRRWSQPVPFLSGPDSFPTGASLGPDPHAVCPVHAQR